MAETPNHDYNTPQKGTADWHVPLNENFKRIDKDLPIRDSEANKGNYEARRGAKYEATDSGAVYYGDGSQWILADRSLNSVNSGSASFGKLFDEGRGSAIVAPSVPGAYDQIQPAIDDGYRDIWLCEDITENNITIPGNDKVFGEPGNPFCIRGMSASASPTIHDPETGDPIITRVPDENVNNFVLKDFSISGGVGSGPVFDLVTGVSEGHKAAFGLFENIKSKGGPWRLWAGRHMVVRCANQNVAEQSYTIQGKEMWPAITTQGATFAMYGGTWNTTRGEDVTALSSGAFSLSGGATFNNQSEVDGRAALTITGASRGTFSGFSCESEPGQVDVRIGLENGNSPGMADCVFSAPSWGGGDTESVVEVNQTVRNSIIMCPNTDLKITQNANTAPRCEFLIFSSDAYDVTVEGPQPQDISRIGWGVAGQVEIGGIKGGETQFKLPVLSSPPKHSAPGCMVIADGTDWNPTGSGNAAKVIYNGSDWIVDTNLNTAL